MKILKICVIAALVALSVERVAVAAGDITQLQSGMNDIVITQQGGIKRQVLIELPQKIVKGGHPVVIGMHGAGGPVVAYNRRLKPFVNQYGLISVSPLATETKTGVTAWAFTVGAKTNADDVGLMKDIIALLDTQGLVDHARIYATGSSSGGLMAYRLARETDLFAAIAPTKCGMTIGGHEPLEGTRPLSIMQVIGDADKSYHGSSGQYPMYSAKERIDIWSTFNKCGKPVFKDHGTWTSTHYGCDDSKEIELVTLKGVGHSLGKWAPITDEMLIRFLLKQRK